MSYVRHPDNYADTSIEIVARGLTTEGRAKVLQYIASMGADVESVNVRKESSLWGSKLSSRTEKKLTTLAIVAGGLVGVAVLTSIIAMGQSFKARSMMSSDRKALQ